MGRVIVRLAPFPGHCLTFIFGFPWLSLTIVYATDDVFLAKAR